MKIDRIKVGYLRTNCYLIEQNNETLIIDPGDEYDKIKEFIKDKNLIGILLTHNHFDHTGCINDLINDYNISLYDNKSLREGINNISTFNFEVIKTYGHTMDSITFYFKEDKVMFTGDFLFYDTIGRCDLEESNIDEMKKSIDKIKKYSDDITIYPGHGKETNLGREKKNNIYFNEFYDRI